MATRSLLIDADDLEGWSAAAAHAGLPQLAQMLLAHSPGVKIADANGSTSGALAFADGSTPHPFVPLGRSVWAFVDKNDLRKTADNALAAITDNPDNPLPADTSLILVTHRRTAGRDASSAASPWKDVKLVGADELQTWLETLPVVHLWTSELLGKPNPHVYTLGFWWSRWSRRTGPPTPRDLLLAGRSEELAALQERAAGGPGLTRIRGQSAQEAAAFTAAAMNKLSAGLAQITGLVAIDMDGLRLSCAAPPGTVLLGLSDDLEVAQALDVGLHVILPMGAAQPHGRADVALPLIPRDEATTALMAVGLPRERAQHLASVARRSLLTFRRALEFVPGQPPIWAQPPVSTLLAPLMLVGSWLQSNEADILIVTSVAERKWDGIERELAAWANSEDPPWRLTAGNWYLTDPRDAWVLLCGKLIASDIERWEHEVITVLGERDPALDLPVAERHLAGFRGIHRQWSGELRRGLAGTLALLGAEGATPLPGGSLASDRARSIVARLLADGDSCERWQSLLDVLPLLAEAAPEEFLGVLEAGIYGADPPLRCLFQEPQSPAGIGPPSPHFAVVSALEVVSWSASHLQRATNVLARLAELDPGGRSGNRPGESLRRIFVPWLPRTSATLDERMAVLNEFDRNYAHVAWTLRMGLLPSARDLTHNTHRPRFRIEWIPDYEGVSRTEWETAVARLVDGAVAAARGLPARWPDLISRIQNLMPSERKIVFEALAEIDPDAVDKDDRLRVWQQLTETAARHGKYRTARWALPAEDIERVAALTAQFEPVDDIRRYARLFSWHVDLPGTDPFDYQQHDQTLRELRTQAALTVWRLGGIGALVKLAEIADQPAWIGSHAAEALGAKADAELVGLLHGEGSVRESMSAGWVGERYTQDGWLWADALVRKLAAEGSKAAALRLLLSVPAMPEVWGAVAGLGPDCTDSYWRSISPWSAKPEHIGELVSQLIEHDRSWLAIQVLAQSVLTQKEAQSPLDNTSVQLVVRALQGALAANTSAEIPTGAIDDYVDRLIDALRISAVSTDLIAQLEWAFFPLLEETHRTPALFSQLSSNPEFFVGLVSLAFRPANEGPSEGDAGDARMAFNAYEVLRAWRSIPGTTTQGIDSSYLLDWAQQTRDLLSRADRVDIGDQQIGQMLSASPPGQDGAWPHEAVRDLIEAIGSQHIIIGFRIGTFNARGVTSRSALEGGAQERVLAEKYRGWAATLRLRWPRTASALDELGHGYERDAQREDESAARWADGD